MLRKILVTGSSGHLGEAMMRRLVTNEGVNVVGIDIKPSEYTTHIGSVTDQDFVNYVMEDVSVVYHTCTLHKPHINTHTKEDYIETNIKGTLNLLEECLSNDVSSFIFTSTTSVFGDHLRPRFDEPAPWITEELPPIAKNIYGATKSAAEDLCRIFHRNHGLNIVILRTSRFFPEEDDDIERRNSYSDDNLKVNELLYRRVDIEDIVEAQLLASEKSSDIGFGKYIITSTTPFKPKDLQSLRTHVPDVLDLYVDNWRDVYDEKGWKMLDDIDRVYVNSKAVQDLGWNPKYTFQYAIEKIRSGEDFRSPLSIEIGSKGYH